MHPSAFGCAEPTALAQSSDTHTSTPLCSFVLEVDELSGGKVYTVFIPVEITGRYAEQTAAEVEPGDVLQISGKWKYKSIVDPKSGVKVSKPVVSSWGVSQWIPALATLPQEKTSDVDATTDMSGAVIVASHGVDEVKPTKKGCGAVCHAG